MFLKKINTVFYFYDYCYTLVWQKIWHKLTLPEDESGGIYFAVTCFIIYLFLLSVILWHWGVHAHWSFPVMMWLDMAILIYGIYLGSKRAWRAKYFRVFSRKRGPRFGVKFYLLIFSPLLAVLVSLLITKPSVLLPF